MIKSRYELHIPGCSSTSGPVLEVWSPYSGEKVGEVRLLDAEGMDRALDAAHAVFRAQRHGLPAYERAAILQRLAGLLEERHEELALLIAGEGGKPLTDARIETTRAINTVRLSAEEATRLHGEEIPMQGTAAAMGRGRGRLAFTTREPIGVVAAVSAFNHPLNLIAHQVAPAVAAGCPVLVKPASDTPLSCMVFMELLGEAGLPPGWGMAVPCARDVAEKLVTCERIAFLSFIGSAEVGWRMRSRLAPGVRCTLEHGGSAPVIVDQSADLDLALPLLLKGGYYHAGQVCVSVQRIFVHRALKERLLEMLVAGAESLEVGDPTQEKTQVGPLIRAAESTRVHEWVVEAREAGAGLATGGKPLEHQCYAPTVLIDAPVETRVMSGEIFGPVVAVNAFDTLDEAIDQANGTKWSFQAAVFCRDVDRAFSMARRIEGAAVMINDHTAFRVDWMPFGGRGPSGLGVGGVGPSIRDLSEEKLIVIKLNEDQGSSA